MDQSQFQAYEMAGATDMNRLHQFPQDYFQEVVEGFIGDVSDALFGSAGFSSAIVAGPSIDITVAAQTFAAAGRIGSVGVTIANGVSSVPGDTQRFYVYLDIQTTEVTESRDIANPGTGIKTPTMIVTHKTAAAGIVVIEVNQGDPEAPPPLGVIAAGVERLGFILLGYVDYNQTGVTNVDVFNTAGIFAAPGTFPEFNDLTDCSGAPGSAGDVPRSDGTNLVVTSLSINDLAEVSGAPGSVGEVLTSDGVNFTPQPLPRRQVRSLSKTGLIDKVPAGSQTMTMVWSALENPDAVPPNYLELQFFEFNTPKVLWIISAHFDSDETAQTYALTGRTIRFSEDFATTGSGNFNLIAGTAWATTTTIMATIGGTVIRLRWLTGTRTLEMNFVTGTDQLTGDVIATVHRVQET